ncbi:MAG: HPP family protein [Acidimicrobiales bacterium]|nr:HPP family protein [Acidimicrobiales bacterium]
MTEPERPGLGPASPGPIGGDMAAILWGLARRFRIPVLTDRHDNTKVMGLFAGVNGLIAIAIMSAVAFVTGQPFIFPSLGPTAFLLFYTPTNPAASPRNTIIGHAVGAAAGYVSLVAFGLTDDAPALATEVTGGRIGAAALSLALTSAFMVWLRAPHPPAGATTLIVSLGILREPDQLAILMLAVAVLTLQGFAINRLAGIDYPAWRTVSS